MKKFILLIIILLFFVSILSLSYWKTRDQLMQIKYDFSQDNSYVKDEKEILEIFDSFESISKDKLDPLYIKNTAQDQEPFVGMVKGLQYYKIPQSLIYQKIVGDFRIKHFLPKDSYYKEALFEKNAYLYCLLDYKMVLQVLAFQDKLEEGGYDRDAFIITNGYRHPAFNKQVKGASQSRHIVGEAVDITALDINRDGVKDQKDKAIIVAAAEFVVGNKGGVGLYPGTLSIHMDTRGYKARWNSY